MPYLLTIVKNKIALTAPFDNFDARSIHMSWDKRNQCWTLPLDEINILKVCKCISDIRIDNSIREYSQNDSNFFPEQHSDLLKDYQNEASNAMLNAKKGILALEPGLGKSVVAAFAGSVLTGRKLVVCQLSLMYNWSREITKFSADNTASIEISYKYKPRTDAEWVVTNYDTFVNWEDYFLEIPWSVLIIDESVLIKNKETKRFKAMKRINPHVPYVWLLSGSPTTRHIDDLWTQLRLVRPSVFSSYWSFAEEYCIIEKNYWGTRVIGTQTDAIEKIKSYCYPIYFARTQEQVADIPDWIFDTIEIPMSTAQAKIYAQMEKTFIADLPSGDNLLAPNVVAQMVRLMQISSNHTMLGEEEIKETPKWRAAIDLLNVEELPVIIWTAYIATAHAIADKLSSSFRVGKLTGDTPARERDTIVNSFQAGNLDIIVAHPAVGKFGLTLTKSRTCIYLERTYNGDDYIQSLFRVKRIGTEHSPHIIKLLSVKPDGGKTIDHIIDKVLSSRREDQILLTTGLIRNEFNA